MTLKAAIPLDEVRTILNTSEFAETFAYTVVDLTGLGSDVTTTITGLFDPSLDVENETVIETAIEVLIANGTISRIAMATTAPDGVFEQGETITGGDSGATGTFAGQADGILYYRVTAGVFVLDEVITGSIKGATWSTHLTTPALAVEGIAVPKAGDRFVARLYNWQVDAVEPQPVAGTFLIGAKRGAIV